MKQFILKNERSFFMPYIDLHTHTTYSDGTFTPTELIDYAAKKELKAIAITDHDNFDGVSEAVACGEKKHIEVISGIEMSTDFEEKEIHIVGLFINTNDEDFNSALTALKEKRKKRNKLALEKLQNLGINITYKELENTSKNKIITRAHFAKVLMEKKYVSSVKECFEKYMGEGKPAYVKREVISPEETIHLITKAGGIAILAHPLLYNFTDEKLKKAIQYLKSIGLKGMECIYSTHTKEDVEYTKNLAQKYDLLISGGSDFHGDNKPGLDLGVGYGNLYVPYDILETIKRNRER